MITLYCPNPDCSKRAGGKPPQTVGECDTPGATLRLRCPKCRQIRQYVVREATRV